MEYKRLTKGRQKYSNSYIFYNNIYMRNVTNKERLFISLIIGLSYVIFPIIFFSTEIFKVDIDLFISIIIFTVFSYFGLLAFFKNKLSGTILIFSISFLSPYLYQNYVGELFPLTYIAFITFFSYNFGLIQFKKWKSSL